MQIMSHGSVRQAVHTNDAPAGKYSSRLAYVNVFFSWEKSRSKKYYGEYRCIDLAFNTCLLKRNKRFYELQENKHFQPCIQMTWQFDFVQKEYAFIPYSSFNKLLYQSAKRFAM